MARILILEDDPDDAAFLEAAIAGQPDLRLVAAADTCADARRALDEGGIDAAVLDVVLPDGSGLDVLERVVELGLPAMVLTTLGDEETTADAITKGASGYLMKDSDADRVGDSIQRVLAGEAPLNARVARHLLERLPERQQKQPAAEASPLTPTEQQVLELVARGYTHTECAEALTRSAHTVTTHIKNIYAKLSVGSRAEAVSQAVAQGLLEPRQLVGPSSQDESS